MRFGSILEISRRRAFSSHLALSAAVVGTVIVLIVLVWYPSPYFEAVGAWTPLRVLVGVDLVVGPVLTLILFRPGKPGLALDLACIALVQLAALAYGVTVLYQERPYYTVFAVDRLHVLASGDTDIDPDTAPAWLEKPLRGPAYAAASLPEGLEERQRVLEETLFEGKPDIHQRLEFWAPYASSLERVIERGGGLELLLEKAPEVSDEIASLLRAREADADDFVFLPLEAKARFSTAIVSRADGKLVAVLDVNAWDVLREATDPA